MFCQACDLSAHTQDASRSCFVSWGLFRCPHLQSPDEKVALLCQEAGLPSMPVSLGFGGQCGPTGLA